MTESSNLRVLHLTTSFPLYPSSTSGIFILRLIRHMPPEIVSTVVTPDDRGNNERGEFENVRVHTFGYAPHRLQVLAHGSGGLPVALATSKFAIILIPSFFFCMFWHTMKYALKSDVIHAHWAINGVVAGMVGVLTRTPVITTLRGEDVSRASTSLPHRLVLRSCLALSRAVVTVSTAMAESICQRYGKKEAEVRCIANGVSERLLSLVPHHRDGEVRILVLGNLVPVKGVDLLIKALARSTMDRSWHLIIAGTGSEQNNLEKLAQKSGLSDRITFAGRVPPEEVIDLLAITDILVQASYREGRPNSVVEAMAAAIPVIGSDIDGISELIEHGRNGLLFPVGDIKTLAEHLQLLVASPEKRLQLGRSARQTLKRKGVSWKICARTYARLYRQTVGFNRGLS